MLEIVQIFFVEIHLQKEISKDKGKALKNMSSNPKVIKNARKQGILRERQQKQQRSFKIRLYHNYQT